jgi:chromosome segregation ATPase
MAMILLVDSAPMGYVAVAGKNVDQMKDDLADLKNEAAQLENKIAQLRKDKAAKQELLNTLQQRVDNTQNQIDICNQHMAEIEAKIAEFEKTHAGEEYKAFIAEIKADLAAIKASEPKNHADIADGIAAIEAKINAVADCDHMCHQSGIMGFFWKIVNFFSKLFGSNPVCECGIAHY